MEIVGRIEPKKEKPMRKDYPKPVLLATYAIVFTLVAAFILLIVVGAILLVRAVLG